jgi:hypothetical protein
MPEAVQDNDIDMDMNSALASMGEDLIEDEDSGGDAGKSITPLQDHIGAPAVPATPVGSPAPVAATEPWRAAPKAWKQDLHPEYGKFPPQVMQYIHEREKQALDGIMQYKTPLDEYNKVFNHYKAWFDHHQIKPMEAFTQLANSHIALLQATPDVKAKYLEQLINDYDLDGMLRQRYSSEAAVPPPPERAQQQQLERMLQERLAPLQQKLTTFEQRAQAGEQARQETELAEINSQVDKFLASPENEFAQEVVQDMASLIQSGLATDLKTAYDKAVWINPVTKAKLFEREVAKAAAPKGKPLRNVRSGSAATASTKPGDGEDVDATMARVLQEINSRT